MKNVMKKQSKRFLLWGFKGLLSVALGSLGVEAHAQSAEVCSGASYTIASTVDASGTSTYQWLENGLVLAGATTTNYTVPNTKAAGVYTYIRQAKSADCGEWQSSNEFTVTVFACSFTAGTTTGATATFTDPRDGKRYKTVVMPDGKTWFAQNLNYTKDLTFNAYANEANGKQYLSAGNGAPAIGSYWCPAVAESVMSGSAVECRTYGALYTWETAMMVDGKYTDETKTSNAWDESWVSPYYYTSGAPGATSSADKNNARGSATVKGGGRGICPMGWHVPTYLEWATLLDFVGGDGTGNTWSTTPVSSTFLTSNAAHRLMSETTYVVDGPLNGGWYGAYRGVDPYGFMAVPAGVIHPPTADNLGTHCVLVLSSCNAKGFWVSYLETTTHASVTPIRNMVRSNGYTVRCLAD